MKISYVRTAFVAVVAAGTLAASPARAQGAHEGSADKLFNDALALVAAGKYPEACPKLEESQRIDPALGTQFNLADCYEHTGRKASARRLFIEVANAARAAGKSERDKTARARAAALDGVVGKIAIALPAGAADMQVELSVDGAVIPAATWSEPVAVDPGAHAIAAVAPGKKRFETQVTSEDGKVVDVTVPELENEAVTPPPPNGQLAKTPDVGAGQRRLAFVVGAVGVAGVVVGTAAGVFSVIKHGQAKNVCASFSACGDADGRKKWDAATDAGTVSTFGFLVGGVGLVAASVLFFSAPKSVPASSASAGWWIAPSVGPGMAGISAAGRL